MGQAQLRTAEEPAPRLGPASGEASPLAGVCEIDLHVCPFLPVCLRGRPPRLTRTIQPPPLVGRYTTRRPPLLANGEAAWRSVHQNRKPHRLNVTRHVESMETSSSLPSSPNSRRSPCIFAAE